MSGEITESNFRSLQNNVEEPTFHPKSLVEIMTGLLTPGYVGQRLSWRLTNGSYIQTAVINSKPSTILLKHIPRVS